MASALNLGHIELNYSLIDRKIKIIAKNVIYTLDLLSLSGSAIVLKPSGRFYLQRIPANIDKGNISFLVTIFMKKLSLVLLLCGLLSACVIHVGLGSYRNPNAQNDSIFGDIQVSSGQTVNNINSVNGSIEISHRVTAMNVETVNGNVEVGDWVRVAQIVTVNGSIRIGENFKSDNKLETINGDINVAKNAKIRGNIQTINGSVQLTDVQLDGGLFNMNGDVQLTGNTNLGDNLVYKKVNSGSKSFTDDMPTLSIDGSVKIAGNIILERPVVLKIDNQGLMEKVIRTYEQK